MPSLNEPLIPFSFIENKAGMREGKLILAGDVGGTKTNLAIFKTTTSGLERTLAKTYSSSDFSSVVEILASFLSASGIQPESICLGVAGPVVNGRVELTNLDWILDINDIRESTGVSAVSLLNDLEATAYGLAEFEEDDFITIHEGVYHSGNMAILSPGTGLGEAGLYFDGKFYHPFPTEGGHCDFSPRSEFDFALHQYLQRLYGVVSWEKLVSGPGIHDIYQFLRDDRTMEEPQWLRELMADEDPSAIISQNAMLGKAEICVETMDIFLRYLAREASNLALKMKSTGGIFLGGGIPPKIAPLLQRSSFRENFLDCDRMQHLLQDIPIRIIMNQKAPVLGAANYAAYGS